jgi:putative endonuclease
VVTLKREFGDKGERLAEKVLLKKGYKLLARNFRSRFGELDLVMQDRETLVFIEVKTRVNTKFGRPEEAVTPFVSQPLLFASLYFLFYASHNNTQQFFEYALVSKELLLLQDVQTLYSKNC